MQTAEAMAVNLVENALYRKFGQDSFVTQICADKKLTLWVERNCLIEVLRFLKAYFPMLYDLFAIDERTRIHRNGKPDSDFTVVYHLLSLDTNEDMRIKVALSDPDIDLPTSIDIWPNAN